MIILVPMTLRVVVFMNDDYNSESDDHSDYDYDWQ